MGPAPHALLLVEDSDFDAELIGIELRGAGIDARIARAIDRTTLLAALAGEPPRLVICDSRLPGLHGAEVLSLVRHAWRDVPVVFCVGTLEGDTQLAAAIPHADGAVDKRDLHALPALIASLLQATNQNVG